jgi:hypothetical protein
MAKLTITWVDLSPAGNQLATDVLHGFIYNKTRVEQMSIPPLVARITELQEVDLLTGWTAADELHVYGAWRRADGLDASETMYFALNDN